VTQTVTKRRATDQARERWQAVRQGARLPRLYQLRVAADDAQWRNQFILRCDANVPMSVFIFCGETAQAALGLDRFGGTLQAALPGPIREPIYAACNEALDSSTPAGAEGSYEDDGAEVLYRSIFLPMLGTEGEEAATYLFGAFSSNSPTRLAAVQ